jgi:hypothetical protein
MKRPASLERFGVYRLLRSVYDEYVRERLPRKIGVYNGVPVRDRALLDVTDEQPEYEGPLVSGIERTVRTGDSVVVVGGGRGVSTVIAARAVGPSGDVTVYEGSREQYDRVEETVRLNRVADRVSVNFEVVGDAVSLWGEGGRAEGTDPEDLPACDVLVLDCEGAEKQVVSDLTTPPSTVVVETHGDLGVAPEDMIKTLESRGYDVTDREAEVPERGIVILTARR